MIKNSLETHHPACVLNLINNGVCGYCIMEPGHLYNMDKVKVTVKLLLESVWSLAYTHRWISAVYISTSHLQVM